MYVDGDTRETLALAQARLAKHGLRIDSNPIHQIGFALTQCAFT